MRSWLHRKFAADLILISQGSALNFSTHKGISHFWFLTQIPCVSLSPLPWNSCVHTHLPFLVSKAQDFGLFSYAPSYANNFSPHLPCLKFFVPSYLVCLQTWHQHLFLVSLLSPALSPSTLSQGKHLHVTCPEKVSQNLLPLAIDLNLRPISPYLATSSYFLSVKSLFLLFFANLMHTFL